MCESYVGYVPVVFATLCVVMHPSWDNLPLLVMSVFAASLRAGSNANRSIIPNIVLECVDKESCVVNGHEIKWDPLLPAQIRTDAGLSHMMRAPPYSAIDDTFPDTSN